MKEILIVEPSVFKKLVFLLTMLFMSTNSLAELNQAKKLYAQKGYPYEGLINRSEEVTIFYTEISDNISCRVEVQHNGKVWKGEEQNTSVKLFAQKPLRACLNREHAKKLLAATF